LADFFIKNNWLLFVIVGVAGLFVGITVALIIASGENKRTKGQYQKAISQLKQPSANKPHPKPPSQQKYLQSIRIEELYKLLTELTSTLSYQRVLDMALDLSMSSLSSPDDPSDRLVSAVLLFTQVESYEPVLNIAASRRFTRSDLMDTFPAQRGLLMNTINDGATLVTSNISKDPELGRIYAIQSCDSAYCFPLRHGLDTYGVLFHCHPDPGYFTVERREILDIIGNQAKIAIQNARLYHDLEQEKERMIDIQEEARKKLARDLHDGPTQTVAAIAMRVNFARRLLGRDINAATDELFKIEDMARRTTKEIRHMLFTLRPLVLESQGLAAALESMADKMTETFEQNVILDIDKSIEDELGMGKQGVIFAIVEEAVNNARKYAEADHIWVSLNTIQEDIAVLEIHDDGVGFDVDAIDATYENRGSLGLLNMRERTELVNGIITIESTVGQGSRIQVIIPFTEDATDRLRRGGQAGNFAK
jgi:signal transduction histidine kinase